MLQKIRYTLVIAVLLPVFAGNILSAQNVSRKSVREAERAFMNASFDEAAALFSDLAAKDPKNFDYNFKAGVSWFYAINTYSRLKGLPYLEAANKVNTPDTVPELYYYLGRTYHVANRFDDAIASYSLLKNFIQTYSGDTVDINEIKHLIEMAHNGKKMMSEPVKVTINNLGPEVNSQYMDYAPTLPTDESFIVFTSRREGTTGGKKDDDDLYFEDIFIARKSGDKFQQAQNVGENVNTKKHDASVAVSTDGKRLYLYKAHDIWVSTREGDNWEKPVKLLPDVNSRSYEPSITLSADEKTIYFVSERKGGQGGKDIWKSTKMENGKWSSAENLGPTINTAFDEDSPFLSADGKTLYFSSQGHNSMGGFDVFRSSIAGPGAPENLGYPINSSWDDIFYVINPNTQNAYYSTIKDDTHGDLDIYMVMGLSDPVEPVKKKKKVRLIIQSSAADKVSTPGDTVTAIIENLLGQTIYDSISAGNTVSHKIKHDKYYIERSFSHKLPENAEGSVYQEIRTEELKDKNGKVNAVRTIVYNAFFNVDSLLAKDPELSKLNVNSGNVYSKLIAKLDTNKTPANLKVYTYIDKIPDVVVSNQGDQNDQSGTGSNTGWTGKRDSLRFAGIPFDYEKAELTASTKQSLDAIYDYLSSNKDAKLEIHGHTDSKGSETYNMELSKRRANGALSYLRSKGISAKRLKVVAHGEAQPVAPNENPGGGDDPAGREKNRRVEFIIITP